MLRVKVVIVNKLATFIKVVYVNISAERLIWYFSLISKHKKSTTEVVPFLIIRTVC